MTEELQLLARAHACYLRAPAGMARESMERIIDGLTAFIAAGRRFADVEADPWGS